MPKEAAKVLPEARNQRSWYARWLPVIFFWVFQVALLSTTVAHTSPASSGVKSLQTSLIAWGVWGLLAPLIVGLDRWLPIPRDAIFKRFVIHIPFSLFFTALNMYADMIGHSLLSRGQKFPTLFDLLHREGVMRSFQTRFYVFWMVLFIYIIFDYASHLKEREIRTAELERLISEARLEALRARLHPHFFFNTLNTISAKLEREPRTARRMLEELGQLLRLSMSYADDQEIPLTQEVAFIQRYLSLQKTRFDERLTAIVDVDPEVQDALVPTFILQPLVENAIRHGIASRLENGLVEAHAWKEGGSLRLRVLDNGPGLPPGWNPERVAGIGISNTRERLRQLYGDVNQAFEIHSQPGMGVRVDIRLPFHRFKGKSPVQDLWVDYGQHSYPGS